jgi:hypothetical protein
MDGDSFSDFDPNKLSKKPFFSFGGSGVTGGTTAVGGGVNSFSITAVG